LEVEVEAVALVAAETLAEEAQPAALAEVVCLVLEEAEV
jgi:hypothetical protein